MFDLYYKGTIAFVYHLWVMEQATYDPFPGHRAKEMLRGKMAYLPDHYLETSTSDWSHDF